MIAPAETPLSQQFKRMNQHGEFELVAAVLERAVADIELMKRPPIKSHKRYDGRMNPDHSQQVARRTDGAQALAWVKARPHRPSKAWSFVWCCEVLGLEPVILRDRIISNSRLKEQEFKSRARNRGSKIVEVSK